MKRSRARLRDRAVHVVNRLDHGRHTLGHHMVARGHGALATARYLVAGRRVEDDVLHERLRAELDRHVSHPHSVGVHVDGGNVTLTGDVLAREARRTRLALRRVPGVRSVTGAWTAHARPSGVPALQGGRTPAVRRWSPGTRVLAGTAAAGTLLASRRAPTPIAWALRGTGTAVGVRAATNLPLRRVTSADRGAITRRAAVRVTAPAELVWAVVSDEAILETIMPDMRLTAREEGRRVSWRTREGAPVAATGTLRLDPVGDGRTRIQVRLTYHPGAGALGQTVAHLLGTHPARTLLDDLQRLKAALES